MDITNLNKDVKKMLKKQGFKKVKLLDIQIYHQTDLNYYKGVTTEYVFTVVHFIYKNERYIRTFYDFPKR